MATSAADLLAEIAVQQESLRFARFSDQDAWELGVLAVNTARARNLAITIDIRKGDHQVFHSALPGTSPNNAAWIERKINTTRRFGRSSLEVRLNLEAEGAVVGPEIGLDPITFVAGGGCVPLVVQDVGAIGTMTVSGLSDIEDHTFVVEVLSSFLAVNRTQ